MEAAQQVAPGLPDARLLPHISAYPQPRAGCSRMGAHQRQPNLRLPDPAHHLEIAPEPDGLELCRNTKLRHQIQTIAEP